MDAVLSVIAFVMLLGAVVGTIVTVRTVRAVRRGVDRTRVQARRVVEETALKAKSVQPGALGELAALRLELRGAMTNTNQALESGVAGDPSLTEALALLERLRAHANALDGELRLMEREPDRGRIAARLPELRERAGRIAHSADSLRWAAQDRARQFDDDDLAALGRQIEVEAGALRHWVPTEPPGVPTEPTDAVPPTASRRPLGKSFGTLGRPRGRG
jgi:hypothetical protein